MILSEFILKKTNLNNISAIMYMERNSRNAKHVMGGIYGGNLFLYKGYFYRNVFTEWGFLSKRNVEQCFTQQKKRICPY